MFDLAEAAFDKRRGILEQVESAKVEEDTSLLQVAESKRRAKIQAALAKRKATSGTGGARGPR